MGISDWSSDVCSSDLVHRRRLKPAFEQERDHRHGLDSVQPQHLIERCALVNRVFDAIAPENGWFALTAARASKPLPQAGNRRRGADLRTAFHGADVDAKLECCRTNGSCWPLLLFERRLGLLAHLLRQAPVMRSAKRRVGNKW